MDLRKERDWFQSNLVKKQGVREMIGRYEHNEVNPSIEMAKALAEALEVSLDYLIGSTDNLLDKVILNRVLDIQKLKDEDKKHVFALMDAFINRPSCRGYYERFLQGFYSLSKRQISV
jgi:transcriptional regulator with XRE-family HTH domain